MDLIKLKIPAAFIMSRVYMSWREVQFGLANELLDHQALVDCAVEALTRVEQPSNALIDLASSSRNDPVRDLVDQLSAGEVERTEAEIRDKWLYVVLAWLYEQRGAVSDPLQSVEEVYADFGYPEEVAGFVRYMPMDGPDLGSREANERRLIERWKQYLDSTATKLLQ
jgi:hypothetical protein